MIVCYFYLIVEVISLIGVIEKSGLAIENVLIFGYLILGGSHSDGFWLDFGLRIASFGTRWFMVGWGCNRSERDPSCRWYMWVKSEDGIVRV
jgi:hypothetical protein